MKYLSEKEVDLFALYATRFFHYHKNLGYTENRKIEIFIEKDVLTNQIKMGWADCNDLIKKMKENSLWNQPLLNFLEDVPLDLLKIQQGSLQLFFAQNKNQGGYRESLADRFLALRVRRLSPQQRFTDEEVATALLVTKAEHVEELLANLTPAQIENSLPFLTERLKQHDLSLNRITVLIRKLKKDHLKQPKKIENLIAELAKALPPSNQPEFFAPLLADFWYRSQDPKKAGVYWQSHVKNALQNKIIPQNFGLQTKEPTAQQILRSEYHKLQSTLEQQPVQTKGELLRNAFVLAKNCQDWDLMNEIWPEFAPLLVKTDLHVEGLFPKGGENESPEFFDFWLKKLNTPTTNKKEQQILQKIGHFFVEQQTGWSLKGRYSTQQRTQIRDYIYTLPDSGFANKREEKKKKLLLLPSSPQTHKLAFSLLSTPQSKNSTLPIYAVEYLLRKNTSEEVTA